MKRRGFVRATIGSMVAAFTMAQARTVSAVGEPTAIAQRIWAAEEGESVGLASLSTSITGFITNIYAERFIQETYLSHPQDVVEDGGTYEFVRILLDTEFPFPDFDSPFIAFLIDHGGAEGHFIVVQVENLVYEFVLTASGPYYFGRGYFDLIVQPVIERSEPKVPITAQELVPLLPTLNEVKPSGLTRLVSESVTNF